MEKVKNTQHHSMGILWVIGWLFTIGYLRLTFWHGVLAIIIWPYYIGVNIATLIR